MQINEEKLLHIPLFRGMQSQEIQQALSNLHCHITTYREKEWISRQQTICDSLGILLSGNAQIMISDWHGNAMLVDQLIPYDMFGESYAFTRTPMTVEVVAMKYCEVLWIPCREFTLQMENKALLIQNLLQLMAQKNIQLNQKMTIMRQRTIKDKVLTCLSQYNTEPEKPFLIPFNRQEMADYLGVDRSALSYVLSCLKKEGILSYQKNKFLLHKAIHS